MDRHNADPGKVSLLFMITAASGKLEQTEGGKNCQDSVHLVLPTDAHVVAFSDRPHRIARHVEGGLKHFCAFYTQSDFISDPPNVTFAGNLSQTKSEQFTIFEMGKPAVGEYEVRLPVVHTIGDEKLPPMGTYKNVSLIVDSVWGAIFGWAGTLAAGTATAAACTVGEVVTIGADTAVCVAGVVGTVAAGGEAVDQTVDAAKNG
ncbi:MAG: hypothetical protein KC449_12605 [Anaerolineales bacterium]|nr:hypothetical protein [Anaerolineales bacterium]